MAAAVVSNNVLENALGFAQDLWDAVIAQGVDDLSAEVVLPHGDEEALGVVVGRRRDADGSLVGTSRSNPFEDTAVYEVQFGELCCRGVPQIDAA